MNNTKKLIALVISLWCIIASAQPTDAELSVWVNEAIVSTYTIDFEHFLNQEKAVAKYFTSQGWIDYTQAMQASKLSESIKNNSYYVSAVATLPPTVKSMGPGAWEASMPVLVLYKNPAYKQKQQLMVTVRFIQSTTEGVRGLAIKSLKSTVTSAPCQCKKEPAAMIV